MLLCVSVNDISAIGFETHHVDKILAKSVEKEEKRIAEQLRKLQKERDAAAELERRAKKKRG